MANKFVAPSSVALEPQPYKGVAIAGLVLAIVASVPSLFMCTLRIISLASSHEFSQSQGYALLLPVIISTFLMFTVVPLTGITALILSIIAIVKSRSQARNIAIAAAIIVVATFIMTIVSLKTTLV